MPQGILQHSHLLELWVRVIAANPLVGHKGRLSQCFLELHQEPLLLELLVWKHKLQQVGFRA